MKTSDYPYYQCSFPQFNKAQLVAVPFLSQDVNIVISFNTSVGKTALAECIYGYHLSTNKESKVAFISPFKGISSERHRAWSEDIQLAPHGILICTGDHVPEKEDWINKRLFILTSETLDSKTRNHVQNPWINDLACIVFDEAHLIGQEGRGGRIESTIMRLTLQNPNCRIIMLSATMDNTMEMAKWLKSLNGKCTKCIKSDWRPCKITVRYHTYDDSNDVDNERLQAVMKLVEGRGGYEKIIIFVHSKRIGKSICERIRKSGIRCAFHNASLPAKVKEEIETAFNDSFSDLNIIVSTSTLAAGVNIGG
jgi:replicative superfamily II helicase